jgi:hypothetical protein
VLSIVTNVLEKAVLGAHDSEIAELIEMVRSVSPSPSMAQDIERLHLHLNTVARAVRDRGVSDCLLCRFQQLIAFQYELSPEIRHPAVGCEA